MKVLRIVGTVFLLVAAGVYLTTGAGLSAGGPLPELAGLLFFTTFGAGVLGLILLFWSLKSEVGSRGKPGLEGESIGKPGFWIRLGATLIDLLVLGAASSVLVQLLLLAPWTVQWVRSPRFFAATNLAESLLFVAYFLSFWTYSGQTLGHKILGLRVVRVDGRPLSLGTAALRFLGEMLSWLVLGLGLIWVAFDVNKEGWHDKIARTRVIRTHEQLPAPAANGLGWDEQ